MSKVSKTNTSAFTFKQLMVRIALIIRYSVILVGGGGAVHAACSSLPAVDHCKNFIQRSG